MNAIWRWLTTGENATAVSALAAIAGVLIGIAAVIVAAVYAGLTRRLARASRRQADLTNAIARETQRQADVGRQIFEAAHRPYIEVTLEDAFFVRADHYRAQFEMTNHGMLPAVGITWTVTISHEGQQIATEGSTAMRVLFPGGARVFVVDTGQENGAIEPSPGLTTIAVKVQYRGISGREYATRATLEGKFLTSLRDAGRRSTVASRQSGDRLAGGLALQQPKFGTIPPVLPFLLPWPRQALLIRGILAIRWDDKTWPPAKAELRRALELCRQLARAAWWN